jgi:hypothetical protein
MQRNTDPVEGGTKTDAMGCNLCNPGPGGRYLGVWCIEEVLRPRNEPNEPIVRDAGTSLFSTLSSLPSLL